MISGVFRLLPILLIFSGGSASAEDSTKALERLKKDFHRKTGRNVLCADGYSGCKAMIQKLLYLDWSQAKVQHTFSGSNEFPSDAIILPFDKVTGPTLQGTQAPEGPVTMSLPAPDMQAIKATYEAELRKRTRSKVSCIAGAKQCIAWYDKLLGLDWTSSPLAPEWNLIVGGNETGIKDKTVSLDQNATLEQVADLLQLDSVNLAKEATITQKPVAELAKMQSAEGQKCEVGGTNTLPAANPDVSCPAQAPFYDRLFARETFETTIAFGYTSYWEENYSYEYPAFEDDFTYYRDLVQQLVDFNGFRVASESDTEAVLERKFLYRGETKNARVRIVRSTVRCPGEKKQIEKTRGPKGQLMCPEQVKASDRAFKVFKQALASQQFIMYGGHARGGKGLDFGPSGSKRWQFDINNGALDTVKVSNPQIVLDLTTCDGDKHYSRAVTQKPGIALIANSGPDQIRNAVPETRRKLAALLEARCSDEIKAMAEHQKIKTDSPGYSAVVRGFE